MYEGLHGDLHPAAVVGDGGGDAADGEEAAGSGLGGRWAAEGEAEDGGDRGVLESGGVVSKWVFLWEGLGTYKVYRILV